MDSSKKYDNPSPEGPANFLSRLFFCWLLPFFKYGYDHDLEVKDIYNARDDDKSALLGDQLQKNWEEEIKRAEGIKTQPSLARAITKTFYKSYLVYGFWLFFQGVALRMLLPVVLAEYIKYFDVSSKEQRDPVIGWILACSVVLLSFLNVLIMHQCFLGCQRIGMRCRIACCSLIYRKLLKLNRTSIGQTASGQMVNLLSNDVQRFDFASVFLHFLWITPIQTCIAAYVMYRNVQIAGAAGLVAITLQAIPLQGYLSRLQGRLRAKIAQKTDNRVKLMDEVTSGIKVIKMFAWEKPFEKLVQLARKLEINLISKTSYIKGFSLALMVFTERSTLYLIVITYVLMGKQLSGDIVFSSAQLINTIQLYMAIFYPLAVSTLAEAKVSIKRLEEFLKRDENLAIEFNEDEKSKGDIKLEKVSASWLPNPIVNTLIDINLTIPEGSLCCIVGTVGAGKSSILQLILKELPPTRGLITVPGKVSYASQEPWLFVSNVRNNILFGEAFIKNRYKDVVKVCALENDFEQFPYGDKTPVGERGVSLSGGQRARINLARAVYREADVYLLDDPLAAVDAHVSKHLFEECIVKFLRTKTRVLVTHQLQFLKKSDLIVVVNNGRVEKVGTYKEMSEKYLKNIAVEQEEEEVKAEAKRERLTSFSSFNSSVEEAEPQENQELIEKGAISRSTYKDYYTAGASVLKLLGLAFLFFLAQAATNACDLWVNHWTNIEEEKPEPTNLTMMGPNKTIWVQEIVTVIDHNYYIFIYTIFIIGSIGLTTARSLIFFKFCMNASKSLHGTMFKNILEAPMRFFDTNPSGRILNRFSKDMGAVDELLPRASLEAIQIFFVFSGILVMVFLKSPWMILPTVVLGVVFYWARNVYLATAQDVKRLEGITRAPVFSHLSASLNGLPTIRSCKAQRMITAEFDELQDRHTGTWFMFIANSETFGFYLDMFSIIFLNLVTFQFLVFGREGTLSGDVGLVISQSLILTGMLQHGIRQTAEVASNMTSVERILQYTKLEKEGPFETSPGKQPPKNWPEFGAISFKNLYLRYVADELPVLKNFCLDIKPGEKIGIVGRTGAGKSSIISSLFRLAPIEGEVVIDGVKTSDVGLAELRRSISIIPQEPVLFSNSVRYNLDPFEKHSDEVLWSALEGVEMKAQIKDLMQKVDEGGNNFSFGQRQLLCLARAIVHDNKILIMDEATANVDPHTDNLIQRSIRTIFKKCTVLCIAHRLNTIMDSDKVLVMGAGQALEFDHPHVLLQNENGYFSKMLKETGPATERELRKVAEEDYSKKYGAKVGAGDQEPEVPNE